MTSKVKQRTKTKEPDELQDELHEPYQLAEWFFCGAGGAGGTRQVWDLSDLRDSF